MVLRTRRSKTRPRSERVDGLGTRMKDGGGGGGRTSQSSAASLPDVVEFEGGQFFSLNFPITGPSCSFRARPPAKEAEEKWKEEEEEKGGPTYLIDGRARQIEAYCAAEDAAQTVLQLLLGFRGVLGACRPTSLLVRLVEVLGLVVLFAQRRRDGGHRRCGYLLRDAARRCRLVARVRHVACFGVFP